MQRLLALALALILLLPATALALTGQRYETFNAYYKENVTFINENDNRHLLPMVLSQTQSQQADGRIYYEIIGDVLRVTVTTDQTGIIEACEIRLTAPQGMAYGSSTYTDFAISGYHSYAFLMAMDVSAEPAQRYTLVTDVVEGMRQQDGLYTRQLGAYTLTCTRENNTAVLTFQNNGVVQETAPLSPDETPTPSDTPAGEDAVPSEEDVVSDEEFVG